VQGAGCKVQSFRVYGFRIQVLGLRVKGLGLRVEG
jgi:hypothetical protein